MTPSRCFSLAAAVALGALSLPACQTTPSSTEDESPGNGGYEATGERPTFTASHGTGYVTGGLCASRRSSTDRPPCRD